MMSTTTKEDDDYNECLCVVSLARKRLARLQLHFGMAAVGSVNIGSDVGHVTNN